VICARDKKIIIKINSISTYKVYLSTRFVESLLFTSIVTVNLVYQAIVVGLNPLQLVLVGTLLETVCFLSEIPTGLLADVHSRKLSTVIGVILIGKGFVIEGSFPTFLFVMLSQIIWGLGTTFVSGAREAWITDEIGEARANKAFLHGEQLAQIGAIIGIIISVALASVHIRLPIILGGALYSCWGICLLFLMKEVHYHPTPKDERPRWQHLTKTFLSSAQLIKGHHVLLVIISISGVFGMFSEGFDRLWTPYLLQFTFPAIGNLKPIVWFGIISLVGMGMTIVATEISKRYVDTTSHQSVARFLLLINVLLMVSAILFGLATNFAYAILAYWFIYFLRETNNPLHYIWLNQNVVPNVRATVFSMSNQSNALGQILLGPIMGLIATVFSLRIAMIGSGVLLLPIIFLYLLTIRKHKLLR
jgi:DHA3 family tetracycline resistance protein-like MFS transporter